MGDHDGLKSVITIGWNAQESASALVGRILADSSNKSIDAVAFGTAAADEDQRVRTC